MCVCACLCERTNHVAMQNSNHIEQHLFEFGEAPMLVVHLVTKLQPYTGDVSSCPAPVDRFRVLDSPRAERQLISRCCCCLLPLSIFWGGVCISFSFSSFEHRIVVDGRHPQLYSERNRATRKSKQLRVRRTPGRERPHSGAMVAMDGRESSCTGEGNVDEQDALGSACWRG